MTCDDWMGDPWACDPDAVAAADRICDDDCRGANGCRGHVECPRCGEVVCGCDADPDTGLCDVCIGISGEEGKEGYGEK